MRLAKPHSLSYHDKILTNRPSTTWVWVRSKIELAGLWLKSVDTSGTSLTARIPLSLPLAARTMASLIWRTVVRFLAVNVRSTSDTLAVGTRSAVPSSLPASAGSTRPTARAAPVEVGMMLSAAARARCKSSCRVSWMR